MPAGSLIENVLVGSRGDYDCRDGFRNQLIEEIPTEPVCPLGFEHNNIDCLCAENQACSIRVLSGDDPTGHIPEHYIE
jgi:hypothetical protein